MHKFYWNNKQPQSSGCNRTVEKTHTAATVYDKTRQNAQQQHERKKGTAKMPYSKSEYNFNATKATNPTELANFSPSHVSISKMDFENQATGVHPQLPKRSDGGVKTVVRVTSSPLQNEDSSTGYHLSTSKSHSDMRAHLHATNNHGHSNGNEKSQSTNNNTEKVNKTPVGSHRVLLKLRRLSGRENRPKSIHGVDQISIEGNKGHNNSNNKASNDQNQSDSVSLKGMSTSRSVHQFYFYNRTWNERSLQKYSSHNAANSHNYENVYSGDLQEDDDNHASILSHGITSFNAPPVYENITVAAEYQRNAMNDNNPLIISALTCSPKSTVRGGSRISILPSDYHTGHNKTSADKIVQNVNQNWAASALFNQTFSPVPPERKGRRNDRNASKHEKSIDSGNIALSNNVNECMHSASCNHSNNHRHLYRSKSCERPKIKDAVRDTFKLISNETSDRLQTNLNRLSTNFTDKFLTSNSIMNKFACGSGNGSGSSTRSNNSSHDGKNSHSSRMSTGSSDCSSKNSNISGANENALLQTTSLQSVGLKNFIPCVDIQVSQNDEYCIV